MQTRNLPELLAPAGSASALEAAICGGADAVYFGGKAFNARANAKNFDSEAMAAAFRLCHAHGVKAYVTLNTQIYDRELEEVLAYVGELYRLGADALIVADLGVAALVRRHYPHLPIHASTQCTAHNTAGVQFLADRGFSRVVCARELSAEQIRTLAAGGTEIEMFIHGAHCVSVSGQCLMSYALGGRSGNRGECAQPCRLPYSTDREGYPLSLKDMSLARHIPEIVEMGVASLKIEGRMKSPAYVWGVTSVYRRLLDEGRGPTREEEAYLESLFSRCGFTDGYYRDRLDRSMLGVRTEENKQAGREAEEAPPLAPVPVTVTAEIRRDVPLRLTVTSPHRSVTVTGDAPLVAQKAPMQAGDYEKNLSKFGGTPFAISEMSVTCDEGLMVPVSRLNALRREAVERLTAPLRPEAPEAVYEAPSARPARGPVLRVAAYREAAQITPLGQERYPVRFLPVDRYHPAANGVELPPVVYDNEWREVRRLLTEAREKGAEYALVANAGQIAVARELGFRLIGSHRLNVFNRENARVFEGIFEGLILSAELSLRQAQDFPSGCGLMVYGKLPLMHMHRCIIRDVTGGCDRCATTLTDRKGVRFPVLGGFGHRCTVYNSVPTYMADRREDLARAGDLHFYRFTDETPKECDRVTEAYRRGTPSGDPIRRIP